MRPGKVGGVRPLARSGIIASFIAVLALVMSPSGALAAPVVIGSATGLYGCCGSFNMVQSTSPLGVSYAVPTGGAFITSWSTDAGPFIGPVGLQGGRKTAGSFTLVGASPEMPLSASVVNTFTLATPIPVQAGDLLGLRIPASTLPQAAQCVTSAAGGAYSFAISATAPAIGAVVAFSASPGYQLDVAATVDTVATPPGPVPPGPVPPGPVPPGPGTRTGCESAGDAHLRGACGATQTQTLFAQILTAALRAYKA